MRSRTSIFLALGLLATATAGWWWWQGGNGEPEQQYRTARVERGPLTAVVSASGTINPVASVPVGSQISGQLREVLVDFNSEVKAGQVIARIAPETFEHRVGQARADLEAARAQVYVQQSQVAARRAELTRIEVNLGESRRDLQRKEELVARNFIAVAERDRALSLVRAQEQELNTARASLDVAIAQVRNSEAVVRQREAALRAAQVDLDRTVIRSPVDGVVIKRSVDAGQTVAASLQAPELFVIARNLRDMQVDVSIDESDIGRIGPGQKATFTVDAHPGRRFEGTVSQLRMAATNVQNVITYNVIVTFSNLEGLLMPGMTANVRIVTESRDDVLKVPNAALRLRIAGLTDVGESAAGDPASSAAPGVAARADGAGRRGGPGRSGRIWLLENGKPRMVEVRTGIGDGLSTEVSAAELQEGAEVIIGAAPPGAGRRSSVLRMF